MPVNFLLHVDLVVSDADRSIAFYAEHLGTTVVEDTVLQGALARFYSNGSADRMRLVLIKLPAGKSQIGQMIELLELRAEQAPSNLRADGGRGRWGIRNFTVAVEDLDEAVAALEAKGIQPMIPVTDLELPKLGHSRLTFFQDPDGNIVELVEA